jgi:hypothetical protein
MASNESAEAESQAAYNYMFSDVVTYIRTTIRSAVERSRSGGVPIDRSILEHLKSYTIGSYSGNNYVYSELGKRQQVAEERYGDHYLIIQRRAKAVQDLIDRLIDSIFRVNSQHGSLGSLEMQITYTALKIEAVGADMRAEIYKSLMGY